MYLRELLILNSGALADLTLKASFNSDESPKPIVLVGSNGSGKTGLLSVIADAIIEIAALNFSDVTPSVGMGRQFFRVLGGRSVRLATDFEITAAHFQHGSDPFYYRSKSGSVTSQAYAGRMSRFASLANWPTDRDDKAAVGRVEIVGDIYNEGAYVFFPVDRFEHPFWLNIDHLARDPGADFSPTYNKQLSKQIVVRTAFREIKSWILGLLADSNMSASEVLYWPSIETARAAVMLKMAETQGALLGLHAIMSAILRKQVRIVRFQRGPGDRRICVAYENEVLVPTLENLSSGQTSLLAIFGTILRYGDFGPTTQSPNQLQGVVLVDEIDAHLHADLQHDVLPVLIKMFPRVQFIVTSHSPLFPLGMRKQFGDDGFTLIELPSGLTIDPERFGEFEASYAYFQATQTFEADIKTKLLQGQRPLVLCEGETDPRYLRAAAELLDMQELTQKVDFDWVGQKSAKGSKGSGKDNLDNALRFLKHNPDLAQRKIVLLYDSDANKSSEDHGNIFVRSLLRNSCNTKCPVGIESLLPETVFEERFYRDERFRSGADVGFVKKLQKVALCEYLCDDKREAGDFENFRTPLETLRQTLMLEIVEQAPVKASPRIEPPELPVAKEP